MPPPGRHAVYSFIVTVTPAGIMDFLLILFLIVLNGVFALSEIAVVSSRRARLQHMAEEERPGAAVALALQEEPSRFLSTIQVGITSVGILAGAVGESTLAEPLAAVLSAYPAVAPYSSELAFALVVAGLTYLSVVLGELVPKHLALLAPEAVAAVVARPMMWLARAAKPVVWLLAASSNGVLRLLGAGRREAPPITNEEIRVLMEQGAEAGVFHETESAFVANVLRLDTQRIGAIMTPRKDIYAIDLEDSEEEVREQIARSPHTRVVVCRGGLENILGVLQVSDLLQQALGGARLEIDKVLSAPLYVPETVTTTRLLELFRKSRVKFALVIDEYGDLQGLVTLTDVLTAIVGELPEEEMAEEQEAVQRADGSWLIDASMGVERFKQLLDVGELPEEDEGRFHTLGGFVLNQLGRIPVPADAFECAGLRFEVLDMDRHRVDKLLVSRLPPETADDIR